MTFLLPARPMPKNNLQRVRERLLLSKAELARRAGVSTLTIDRIEAGRPCRMDTMRKIIVALGVPLEQRESVFGADMIEVENSDDDKHEFHPTAERSTSMGIDNKSRM